MKICYNNVNKNSSLECCSIYNEIFYMKQRQYFEEDSGSSSSSSSCRAASTDIPVPLSSPLPIVDCFRQVFRNTSCIGTELLYVGSSWSSCLCLSMWRGQQGYIAYELVPISPAVSGMSGSFNFDSFRDGWWVAVQLLHCAVLSPGRVQHCLQHSCVVAVKLFLNTFY